MQIAESTGTNCGNNPTQPLGFIGINTTSAAVGDTAKVVLCVTNNTTETVDVSFTTDPVIKHADRTLMNVRPGETQGYDFKVTVDAANTPERGWCFAVAATSPFQVSQPVFDICVAVTE